MANGGESPTDLAQLLQQLEQRDDRRLAQVERDEARAAAELESLSRRFGEFADEVKRALRDNAIQNRPQWATWAAVAGVFLLIIQQAAGPYIFRIGSLEDEVDRVRSKVSEHVQDGHPETIERELALIRQAGNRHDQRLQAEMRWMGQILGERIWHSARLSAARDGRPDPPRPLDFPPPVPHVPVE